MRRQAACGCGQLRATCDGEPVRISMCHCLACQRRTGSAFGLQARWPRGKVMIEGEPRAWVRIADSGSGVTFHFCPVCGSTVYYWLNEMPASEIAKAEKSYFPDIAESVLADCIRTYQQLGCWTPHVEITRTAYEKTLDVFEFGGSLKRRYRFDEVCAAPPAAE